MTHRISVKISKLLQRAPSVLRSLEGASTQTAHGNRRRCSPLYVKTSIFEAILLKNSFFQKILTKEHECVSECLEHIYARSNLNFYVSKHIIDVRDAISVDTAKFEKSIFLAWKSLHFSLLKGSILA